MLVVGLIILLLRWMSTDWIIGYPSRITDHHRGLFLCNMCPFLCGFPFSPIRLVCSNCMTNTLRMTGTSDYWVHMYDLET